MELIIEIAVLIILKIVVTVIHTINCFINNSRVNNTRNRSINIKNLVIIIEDYGVKDNRNWN